jgi:hypothetical protein
MRVIPNGLGWDIAVDMVFTDKQTAAIIAKRIRHAVHALIRGAVDETMCSGRTAARDERGETLSATAGTTIGQCSDARPPQEGH